MTLIIDFRRQLCFILMFDIAGPHSYVCVHLQHVIALVYSPVPQRDLLVTT